MSDVVGVLGAAVLLALFAGCGESERLLPPLGLESVQRGVPPVSELESAYLLNPGVLRLGEVEVEGQDPTFELVFGGGSGRIALPWAAGQAQQPHQVRVTVSSAAGTAFRVGFVSEGKPRQIVGPMRAESSRRQELLLMLPPAEKCDELWIAWADAPAGARVHSVHVRDVPPFERVPERATWFDSGGEQRKALGLTPWSDVRVTGEFAEKGMVRLALARPAGSELASAEVWSGDQLVRTLEPGSGPGWTEFALEASGPLRLSLAGDPAGALVVALPQRPRVVRNPRRVLLVTSDTHRGDHLGCAPNGAPVQTPTIDGLAKRGTQYHDAWVTTHITNPSHVALLTATHPRDTGIVDNLTPLAEEAPTLAEVFAAAGFRTMAAVSASHLLPARSGLGQGFERVAGPAVGEGFTFDSIARALAWMDELGNEDVFLWVHVFDAHAPYVPAQESIAAQWPSEQDPRGSALPMPVNVPAWAKRVRDLRYLAALYRAEVDELDARLAPLLQSDFWSDGWIAFTADHGETLGVGDGEFDHRRLDPDNLRVPLILAGPRVPKGSEIETAVTTMDLGRTLLDLAGLDEEGFPGKNLLVRERQGEALYALARHGNAAAITQLDRLLVLQLVDPAESPGARATRRHQVMLFDLEADPACTNDLAEQEPDQAMALRRRLVAWLEDTRSLGWGVATGPADPQQAAELRALGYASSGGAFVGFESDCDCEDCAKWTR